MLVYYTLPQFAESVSTGKINLSDTIPLKNMDHNMIHNVSFIDHCNYLCQKHNTNLLKLNLIKSRGIAILSEIKKKPAIASRLF